MEERVERKHGRRNGSRGETAEMAQIVDRNIVALLEGRKKQDAGLPLQDRLADRITRFSGSMTFVCLHLALFGFWILINLPWAPAGLRFDPTFVVLAMVASVEAIFLSTFVLITQNRMQRLADKRADLDQQISLLAEHEITRLLTLMKAVAEHMGVAESRNPELGELEQDVKPEKVLERIEETERKST
jgi:uncharacterized membrane protein